MFCFQQPPRVYSSAFARSEICTECFEPSDAGNALSCVSLAIGKCLLSVGSKCLDTNLLVTPTWSVRIDNPRRLRFHLLLGNFNITGGANAAPLHLDSSYCISIDWVFDRSSAISSLPHHFR